MERDVTGEVWWWRGPAPFHVVTVPPEEPDAIGAAAARVTYGWGTVPAEVDLGATTWSTSLKPTDGGYVVPLKDAARRAEGVGLGDVVELRRRLAV